MLYGNDLRQKTRIVSPEAIESVGIQGVRLKKPPKKELEKVQAKDFKANVYLYWCRSAEGGVAQELANHTLVMIRAIQGAVDFQGDLPPKPVAAASTKDIKPQEVKEETEEEDDDE